MLLLTLKMRGSFNKQLVFKCPCPSLLDFSNLNVELNQVQRVRRSPEGSWMLPGFENPPFENPIRLEAPKAKPIGAADGHPSPSCGLFGLQLSWDAAEHLLITQDLGEDGVAKPRRCSCKSGDPDGATSSTALDALCPFSIYC